MSVDFGSGPNRFAIDFIRVGNPGNPADIGGAPNSAGSVARVYLMGKYEVSRDMIIKANNLGMLGITLGDFAVVGGNGVTRPATGMSWFEAAKFVNWLNTSSGHPAAYSLSGAGLSLWPSGEAWHLGGENRYRHKGAYYFLPNEDEWYKAAYYDGEASEYYNYPFGSDAVPRAVAGGVGPGTAVYGQSMYNGPASVSTAGGLSPYGTMAQGGNVWEWIESASDGVNDSGAETRVVRGGTWGFFYPGLLSSSYRTGLGPSLADYTLGFRVAAIPEPMGSYWLFGVAVFPFVLGRRREFP